MDSMRSLNTSLPRASPPKQQVGEPPEQLLQSFKAAALSVTKLYKTAAADQGRARSEGYQDALDELLAYLDKENVGLGDGEGWKIRRWATERLDGREVSLTMESDDESGDKADHGLSSEPQQAQTAAIRSSTPAPARTLSPPRATVAPPSEATTLSPPLGVFTFRSSHPYPQEADMTLSDLDISENTRSQVYDASTTAQTSTTPITVARPSRTSARHANHGSRINSRSSNSITRTAGHKRKINFAELFDISNSSHGKDVFGGGGKRGRFV